MQYRKVRRSNDAEGCIVALGMTVLFVFGVFACLCVCVADNVVHRIIAAFFGVVFIGGALGAWRNVFFPTRWEMVVEEGVLRWGNIRKPDGYFRIPISNIVSVCYRSGLSQDQSFLVLKNGARITLPRYIIGTRRDEGDLFSSLQMAQPEIVLCEGEHKMRDLTTGDAKISIASAACEVNSTSSVACMKEQVPKGFSHIVTAAEDTVEWSCLCVRPNAKRFAILAIAVLLMVGVTSSITRIALANVGWGWSIPVVMIVLLAMHIGRKQSSYLLGQFIGFTEGGTVRVTDHTLCVECRGPLNQQLLRIDRRELRTLYIEHRDEEWETDLTLILQTCGAAPQYKELAANLGKEPKEALFRLLRAILTRRGWSIHFESQPAML